MFKCSCKIKTTSAKDLTPKHNVTIHEKFKGNKKKLDAKTRDQNP
jgi:hypothetical protein